MAAIIKTDQLWLDQTTSSAVGAPALIFGADSLSGFYRIGTNNIGLAINGTKLLDLSSGAVAITGTLSASGAATFSSTLAAGNTTITGTLSATGQTLLASSSGNVGVGVTPNASWSTYKVIQLGEQGILSGYTTGAGVFNIGANFYYDGANYKYLTTNAATQYQQNAGTHYWRTAVSGTAGNTLTWTNVMSLDSTGVTVTGSLYASGSSAYGARANASSTDRVSVGTGATTLSTLSSGGSVGATVALFIVNGYNTAGSGNSFLDVVAFVSNAGASLISAIGKGSPAARTYSASGASFQLAMASGTYNVAVTQFEQSC